MWTDWIYALIYSKRIKGAFVLFQIQQGSEDVYPSNTNILTYIHTYLAYNTDIRDAFAGLVSPDENEFNWN